MNVTIGKYKVKTDRAQEKIDYIMVVFAELKKPTPGLHYELFNLEDGLSFVHIATLDDGIEGNPLL
jgi:hypothetical protein